MLYAAASAEPSRGWGGPLALLAAFVAFRLLMPVMRRLRDKIGNPSPTPALPAGSRPKVQATVGVNPREPRVQEYEWGAIGYGDTAPVEPYEEPESPGWRHRLAQARQVMATGSHVLPAPDVDPDPAEDDIDLALDEDEPEEAGERGETAEEYIARARSMQVPYSAIVRAVVANYEVSESTAKRRIREVDEARQNGGR